jgi:Mrp family chromosome partitioning ATPase
MVVKAKPSADSADQTPTNQPKTVGRLVLVTGDKGGTGKSVVARILLNIYRHRLCINRK